MLGNMVRGQELNHHVCVNSIWAKFLVSGTQHPGYTCTVTKQANDIRHFKSSASCWLQNYLGMHVPTTGHSATFVSHIPHTVGSGRAGKLLCRKALVEFRTLTRNMPSALFAIMHVGRQRIETRNDRTLWLLTNEDLCPILRWWLKPVSNLAFSGRDSGCPNYSAASL